MSDTTGYTNNCDVTTIFPMGVLCVTENASSPSANDGSMTVFVTGGTPPYTITWSNGMSGVFTLNNIPPGTYIATVTDYYGDYTESTACVIGAFSVTQTPTPTQTPTLSVTPTLTSTPGGTVTPTITGSETPTPTPSNTAGVSQTPTPTYSQTPTLTQTTTPQPTRTQTMTPSSSSASIPQTMCLELDQSPYTQLEFTYDGNYNGFPQWTATTDSSIVMSFNLTTLRWEVFNYPIIGQANIVNTAQVLVPTGSWTQLGSSNTWTLSTGACAAQPLNISLVTTDETCLRAADGTVVVTMNGGTAPYTLQLNSLPSVSTSNSTYTFMNLNSGNQSITVTDSLGVSTTQNFSIGAGSQSTTYQIGFNYNIVQNGPQTQNSKNQTINWTLVVSPALPAGGSLTFNLNIGRAEYQQTSTNYGSAQVATFGGNETWSTTNGAVINSTTINGPTTYTNPGSICGVYSGNNENIVINMTVVAGSSVTGTFTQIASVPSPNNASCPVYGQVSANINVDSLSISNVPCSVVASENQIISEVLIVGVNQIS